MIQESDDVEERDQADRVGEEDKEEEEKNKKDKKNMKNKDKEDKNKENENENKNKDEDKDKNKNKKNKNENNQNDDTEEKKMPFNFQTTWKALYNKEHLSSICSIYFIKNMLFIIDIKLWKEKVLCNL